MRTPIAILCLIFSINVGAAADDRTINDVMQDLGNTMLRMLPEAYAEDPDRTLLLENLVRLEYLLDNAEPHLSKSAQGADITLDLLQQRLAEARQHGLSQSTSRLQSSVSDAFTLCATCHVQDRVSRPAFGISRIRELDEYLAVEYSFLTRDYDSALTSSQNYFKNGVRSEKRDDIILQRILRITVEVERDLDSAINKLTATLPYLTDNGYNRTRVEDWILVLERLNDDQDNLQSPIDKSIRSLDRFLSEEWPDLRSLLNVSQQEVYWVVVRGELNRLLLLSSSKNRPKIYYWLAVTDRELQYRFYGSLSRAYLESCITNSPKHPYAMRCFREYEFLILISFSGSAGTYVPPEILEQLTEMRKLLRTARR